MTNRWQLLRDRHSGSLKAVFHVLVRLPVQISIWITDQRFLHSLNNPVVGRPSIFGKLFAFLTSFWRAIGRIWSESRADYTLRVFKEQNRAHYAKGGRGYINLDNLSPQERADQFARLTSRLQLFSGNYPVTVGYKDGESFLDAGCGKGQNLKFIAAEFPGSQYLGFDIDERCLQVAETGVTGNANRTLVQGSITDVEFLKSFQSNSFDHVFVCHVFSTLLESSVQATKLSHQGIIDELVRIARRSVMIIDEMSLDNSFAVEIEQRSRATIRENIAMYFAKYQSAGEACVLSCQNFRAVLFKRTEL